MSIPRTARALLAVARRDAAILLSYRSTFIGRPMGILFTLALFYFVSRLVTVGRFADPDAYFAYVAIGIVIIGIVGSSLSAPVGVREQLLTGSYERVELSPSGGTASIVGMLLVPFAYAAFVSALTLVVAALVFGLDVRWSTAALALPLGALGALAFAPFALLLSAVALAFKQTPGQGAVLPALSLVSGLYFPVALLPAWLRWLSDVQPLTPTVDLMRNVLVGFPLGEGAGLLLLRLGGFTVIGLPVGVAALSAAHRWSRRRGVLLET
jgi:ABC-2 type transport system permease protein